MADDYDAVVASLAEQAGRIGFLTKSARVVLHAGLAPARIRIGADRSTPTPARASSTCERPLFASLDAVPLGDEAADLLRSGFATVHRLLSLALSRCWHEAGRCLNPDTPIAKG
jgi:hypothetical protein